MKFPRETFSRLQKAGHSKDRIPHFTQMSTLKRPPIAGAHQGRHPCGHTPPDDQVRRHNLPFVILLLELVVGFGGPDESFRDIDRRRVCHSLLPLLLLLQFAARPRIVENRHHHRIVETAVAVLVFIAGPIGCRLILIGENYVGFLEFEIHEDGGARDGTGDDMARYQGGDLSGCIR